MVSSENLLATLIFLIGMTWGFFTYPFLVFITLSFQQ